MAVRTKRSPARHVQLRENKRSRRRRRERRAEAPTKPFASKMGGSESEKSVKLRHGRQQLRHDRRRRRGQANRDSGSSHGSFWFGFNPAGGDGPSYHSTGRGK